EAENGLSEAKAMHGLSVIEPSSVLVLMKSSERSSHHKYGRHAFSKSNAAPIIFASTPGDYLRPRRDSRHRHSSQRFNACGNNIPSEISVENRRQAIICA